MEQDLVQRLRNTTKEQLILLVRELVNHNPDLTTTVEQMLATLSSQQPNLTTDDEFSAETLVLHRPLSLQSSLSFNLDAYQNRLAGYSHRLEQGTSPQEIFDDLVVLLQEAESRADQYDYQQALSIYALVIDSRLALQHPILIRIFDRSIDEFMPVLAMLLSEASSLITSDDSSQMDDLDTPGINTKDVLSITGEPYTELSPLLPPDKRQLWLERLVSLWLKRLDAHYIEENLPEVILEITWSEDVPLLRSLIEKELYQPPASTHSNIVDFSRQARTRNLEKFLRELPHS